jgi:hypothetical protein
MSFKKLLRPGLSKHVREDWPGATGFQAFQSFTRSHHTKENVLTNVRKLFRSLGKNLLLSLPKRQLSILVLLAR